MTTTEWLTPVGTLFGALLGFLASRSQSREQIRAATVVSARQRWIDELRSELSLMIGKLLRLQIALEKQTPEEHEFWMREVVVASALEGKIALMLNPFEEKHEDLVLAIRRPLNKIREGKQIDWGADSTGIINEGRLVLKDAWNQIKKEAGGAVRGRV